jgi:DNA-binding NarL/FixJ family response regulator
VALLRTPRFGYVFEVRARVLIVDTDAITPALIRQFARACPDWVMERASSAEQAIERCAAASFDLVLIDEVLGDSSAVDVVMDLRAFDPWVGIVMLQSTGQGHETVELLRVGVDRYLDKPIVDFTAAMQELESLLGESQRRRSAHQTGLVPTRSMPPVQTAAGTARSSALVISPLRSEREWIGKQLQQRAAVREIATASAALAIIELAPVDLLIVDADVRDPDAFEFIATVNELIVGVRTVIVANGFTPAEVKRYSDLGVAALIKKPLDEADFTTRILRVVRTTMPSSLPVPPTMRSAG